MPQPSTPLTIAHVLLTLVVLVAWAKALHRLRAAGASARATTILGIALLAWVALSAALALGGTLEPTGQVPPPVGRLIACATVAIVVLVFSPLGRRWAGALPIAGLVGFQLFRLPVELILWRLHREGILPVQ